MSEKDFVTEMLEQDPDDKYAILAGAYLGLLMHLEFELKFARKFKKRVGHKILQRLVDRAKVIDEIGKKCI